VSDDGDATNGDEVARFTSMYRRNYSKVLGYTLAHGERATAEDVANETFITAWRRLEDVPRDGELPWLFAVARNHRLKQRAAGHRHTTIADRIARLTDERDLTVRDTGELVVERAAGLAAFATLSERDAEVLVIGTWYGFTTAEAAQVLGCSTATFLVRRHRARKRLVQALAHQAPQDRLVSPLRAPETDVLERRPL